MKAVEINGKQYPCRITMGAMLRFKRETGKDVTQMNTSDVAELITLLWCCIVSASKADGVEFGMELMDFADQLDPKALTDFYASMKQEEEEKKTENAGGTPASQPTS